MVMRQTQRAATGIQTLSGSVSALRVWLGPVTTPDREPSVGERVSLFREPDAGKLPVRLRVQEKLVCSVGDRPTKVIVRGLVAWIAERREIEFLMPIDKAIFRMVSKSSGRNESGVS